MTRFAMTGTCSWCPADMDTQRGQIVDGLEFCSPECADEYAQECRRVTQATPARHRP